jgi:hypothetical protein
MSVEWKCLMGDRASKLLFHDLILFFLISIEERPELRDLFRRKRKAFRHDIRAVRLQVITKLFYHLLLGQLRP